MRRVVIGASRVSPERQAGGLPQVPHSTTATALTHWQFAKAN
jgi:hypothetical protein